MDVTTLNYEFYCHLRLVPFRFHTSLILGEENRMCVTHDVSNNTENVTYNINRRAYCRFIDSKQIANKNDVKSWS